MKTTIEVPDQLLHRAKLLAARRRTTLKNLFIAALEKETAEAPVASPYSLPEEASQLLEINSYGLPVLKRKQRPEPITDEIVNKLREELGI